MKKLLLASAVAALSVSAAQAAPTVYGKAFLTLDLVDGSVDVTATNTVTGQSATASVEADDNGRSQLNSTGSRIGFKGSEPLTANTDLVYQLEYGVKVDDNSTQFTSRDTYLGLSNKQYGTLLAGRLTAINDMVNYANVTVGGVQGGNDVLTEWTAPRANNAFAYVSPSYNGVNFLGMYVMDEFDNVTVPALESTSDVWGVGLNYNPANQPLRGGITYEARGSDASALRLSGAYDVTPQTTVGALYQLTDWGTDKNENLFTVSGTFKTATPWTAYAQGDFNKNYLGFDGDDAYRVVVGGKYAFNKNTTGHVYGSYLKADSEYMVDTVKVKSEYKGVGLGGGIEYKF